MDAMDQARGAGLSVVVLTLADQGKVLGKVVVKVGKEPRVRTATKARKCIMGSPLL
jgi:hypothetical protein